MNEEYNDSAVVVNPLQGFIRRSLGRASHKAS